MFKQNLSARKLMATVFWHTKGVLIVELMEGVNTRLS
jgi:hypothetical protein